jgi:hypothetical protein
MAAEFVGAVKQLIVLLRRYFTPSGIPPRPAELSYTLATLIPGKVTDDEHRIATDYARVLIKASSTEFVGEFWLRKLAKCVI